MLTRRSSVAALVLWSFCGATLAEDGEAVFQAKCSSCHTQKKVVTAVRKRPEDERSAYLAKFLASHFAPTAAERKAIADFLIQAAR